MNEFAPPDQPATGRLHKLNSEVEPLQRNFELCSFIRCFGCTILMMFLFGSVSSAQSQTPPIAQKQELTLSDLRKLPGNIMAQGTNTEAAGAFKVTTYRLEEVVLPGTIEVEICGQKVQVGKALRLSVIGGPFPVRALPPVIWIDDTAVGYGVESMNLDAITAVTFDYSLLREGATIYLSYGDKKNKDGRVDVPDKLRLKAGR